VSWSGISGATIDLESYRNDGIYDRRDFAVTGNLIRGTWRDFTVDEIIGTTSEHTVRNQWNLKHDLPADGTYSSHKRNQDGAASVTVGDDMDLYRTVTAVDVVFPDVPIDVHWTRTVQAGADRRWKDSDFNANNGWNDDGNGVSEDGDENGSGSPSDFDGGLFGGAGDSLKGELLHHHIVPKGAVAGMSDEINEMHDILLEVGINPFYDRENLVHAPNRGH
jgi:hypothetical protein